MKNSIYRYFYNLFNNKFITKVASEIGYFIIKLTYMILRNISKNIVNIDKESAYKYINRIAPKIDAEYILKERTLNPNIDLSIIIPVYNVEKYLDNCLRSILNQKTTYKYEVIVINDGSTDNSKYILDNYCHIENFKIINQDNRGLSGARNTGIDNSSGKYIMFVDSDDILLSNSIEKMLKAAYENNADIVQGRYYSFSDLNNKKIYSTEKFIKVFNGNIPLSKYSGLACVKLYNSKLFDDVRFLEKYWFEDTLIHYILFRKCKVFICISDVCYGYRINLNGITFCAKKSYKCIDTYWIVDELINLSNKLGMKIDKELYIFTLRQLSYTLYNRLRWCDEEILKNVFVLACDTIEKIRLNELKDMKIIYKDIDNAFKTRNFALWKLCSVVVE